MGGSCSYGERRFVFGSVSKSDGFRRKSDIARVGVIKFRSNEDLLKSTRRYTTEKNAFNKMTEPN